MPVKVESGTYVPDQTVTVYTWPKPDVNGDGEVVYVEQFDDQGTVYAQDEATDENGNTVRHYLPPEGFVNKLNFESQDCWVLADERGRPKRSPTGLAYPISEGQTLVIYSNGEYTHLAG